MSLEQFQLKLPTQSAPVSRNIIESHLRGIGVQPAQQDVCHNLTGLAQQICYAAAYGVNI
jgi:hypothetical protein